MRELPPILTFQSLVDTTVRTDAVVHELYDRLDGDGSELVLFDVNRQSRIAPFFRTDSAAALPAALRPYRLTVVTNASPDTLDVVEQTTPSGGREMAVRPLGLAWPPMVFSLTHIALPFPPSDPVFGIGAPGETAGGLRLGALEPRGERRLAARAGRAVHAAVVQPVLPVPRGATAGLGGAVDAVISSVARSQRGARALCRPRASFRFIRSASDSPM